MFNILPFLFSPLSFMHLNRGEGHASGTPTFHIEWFKYHYSAMFSDIPGAVSAFLFTRHKFLLLLRDVIIRFPQF